MKMAQAREDSAGLAKAMFFKGQTLIHLDETDTHGVAFQLLCKAWSLCPQNSPTIKLGILIYLAVACLKRNQLKEAEQWLEKNSELGAVSQFGIEKQKCAIDFHKGEIALRRKDFHTAEKLYREAIKLAKATGWKRMVAYSKGWLALVLISKGELDEAEDLLQFAVRMSEKHQDKRAIAKGYHDLALLAEKKNQVEIFCSRVTLARRGFEKLGMTAAANQMKQWLQNKCST